MEIRILARQGESIRQISRRMGLSRNTVRRYLRDESARRYGPRSLRPCKLDPYTDYLQRRIGHARPDWIPATVLLREIRERGYKGRLTQVCDAKASGNPALTRDPPKGSDGIVARISWLSAISCATSMPVRTPIDSSM